MLDRMRAIDGTGEEWIGTRELADLFGCSTSTARRSLTSPERADALYGRENWRSRNSPISARTTYSVRRSVAIEMAIGTPNLRVTTTDRER